MATLNLVAGASVRSRKDAIDRTYYECVVFNTNTPDAEFSHREQFAIAVGKTEMQARLRARQIVAACDGGEA